MTCAPFTLLLLASGARAGVELGSYGRVQASTDLQGGHGDSVDVVAHGTRLEKDPYLELDVAFEQQLDDGALFEVVVTPALQGELFHYDGKWDADLAVRNLYVQAKDFSPAPLAVWAGSRMYRGDDVHLFDFWPLDEVNTVGGGVLYTPGPWEVGLHAGLNRLVEDEWQIQLRDTALEGTLGAEPVIVMDRQRLVSSVKASRVFTSGDVTFRVKGWAELQSLPAGTRIEEDFFQVELPADRGTQLGAELSAWGWANDSYVHLFYRRSTGLGAYGDLAVPWTGYATDLTVSRAREHLFAVAGNHEGERLGILWGGYVRRFEDADSVDVDVDDRWENAAGSLRPVVFTGQHTSLALEVSQQWLRPDGLNPRSRQLDVPMVTKVAFLPAIQVRPGSLARPQIRLQYVFTYLNDDARLWFNPQDERFQSNYHHFLGIGAEWWLNSRSYR